MLAADLPELGRLLRAEGWHITIETAGTLPPGSMPFDLASLSPKLGGSTPEEARAGEGWVLRHEQTRIQLPVLRSWLQAGVYQLKFVVGSRADLEEIFALLESLEVRIPPQKVLLMPEGVDSESLRSASREVLEWCKQTGFRFCDRLHVHLFGHTRGT